MKPVIIIGIALIAIGALVLGLGAYSYTTVEPVLKIGPVTASAERTHTIALPAILGWVLVGAGAGALVWGSLSKRS